MKSQKNNNSQKNKRTKKNIKRNSRIKIRKMRGGSNNPGIDNNKILFETLLKEIDISTDFNISGQIKKFYIGDEWGVGLNDSPQQIVKKNIFSTHIANKISNTLKQLDCKIEKLNISNNFISYEGAGQIAEALKTNKSLTSLDISNNNLTGSVINFFKKFLKSAPIPDWCFPILPWHTTLIDALKNNKFLKLSTLNISNTNCDVEYILGNLSNPNIFKNLKNLKNLDISKNTINSTQLLESFFTPLDI